MGREQGVWQVVAHCECLLQCCGTYLCEGMPRSLCSMHTRGLVNQAPPHPSLGTSRQMGAGCLAWLVSTSAVTVWEVLSYVQLVVGWYVRDSLSLLPCLLTEFHL